MSSWDDSTSSSAGKFRAHYRTDTMAVRISIDGVDISQGDAWVARDSWTISNYAFSSINFARFTVIDPLKSFTPKKNAAVRIVDDAGNVLFGGTLLVFRGRSYENEDGLGRRWIIEARGWTLTLGRVPVSGVYTGRTDGEIVAAETTDPGTGSPPGIIHQVNQETPHKFSAGVVESSNIGHGVVPLEYEIAAGVIDGLAATAGYVWWVDHDRRIHYRAQHSIPESPSQFNDDPKTPAEECYELETFEDWSAVVNEVLVLGGYGAGELESIEFAITAADIQTRARSLLYYWAPTVVNNELQTIFERNTETDETKPPVWSALNVATSEEPGTAQDAADVVWHLDRQVLEFQANTFNAQSNALRVTGKRLTLGIVSIRDDPAIDALDGQVFRHVERDPSLVSRPRIDALAQGILNRNRNASFSVSLISDRFVAPAERVRVVAAGLDLDEVLLVDRVDISPHGNESERYEVQLVRLAPPVS